MIDHTGNPFSQILLENKPHLFHGREQILASLIQGICALLPRSFAMEGMKTFGKTTLLEYLNNPDGARLKYAVVLNAKNNRGEPKILFHYVDLYRVEGDKILGTIYRSVAANPIIHERIEEPALLDEEVESDSDAQKNIKRLFDALHDCGVRLVLLLDHLDVAFQTMDLATDGFLRGLTRDHAFILATEKNLNLLRTDAAKTSPLYNTLKPLRLGPLTEDEARQMIEHPLNDASGVPFSNDEVDYILSASGMQPFLIATIGEFFYDLHVQYPEVKNFMETPDFRSQVGYQLIEHPAIAELFSLFWQEMDAGEQQALSGLASGQKEPIEPQIITRLLNKGLLKIDMPTGKKWIYASLFKLFVQHQTLTPDSRNIGRMVEALPAVDRKLFQYLVENPNRLLSFDELLSNVWGDPKASRKGLEAAVHRLRIRIKQFQGSSHDSIQNVRSKGFIYRSDLE